MDYHLKAWFAGFLLCFACLGQAQEIPQISEEQLKQLLQTKIRTVETLGFHPKLIAAVRRQNREGLNLTTIQQRDQEWTNSKALTPFKLALQTNRAGKILTRLVQENESFSEAFLTDNQGANVAAYPPTSDYWQGDEQKWIASFNQGSGQLFIGALERDESAQTVEVQISAPVMDDDQTIGVLVMGVTLSYLQSKQQRQRD